MGSVHGVPSGAWGACMGCRSGRQGACILAAAAMAAATATLAALVRPRLKPDPLSAQAHRMAHP